MGTTHTLQKGTQRVSKRISVGNHIKNRAYDIISEGDVHPTGTPLFAVDSLIQCLLQTADGTVKYAPYQTELINNVVLDGRVTIRSADGKIYLKYQQLNPAVCFDDIVSFARCVILAGGTMSPVNPLFFFLKKK